MNNEELLRKMRRIRNNLENVRDKLNSVESILNQSITFDNNGFKSDEISTLNTKLNRQINNINTKIIPEINNM